MTIRMDILPHVEQGNQLYLIWAFFAPSFGQNWPKRPKYRHKWETQNGSNGHFQPTGSLAKCSSQKKSPICTIESKILQDNPLEHFSDHPLLMICRSKRELRY